MFSHNHEDKYSWNQECLACVGGDAVDAEYLDDGRVIATYEDGSKAILLHTADKGWTIVEGIEPGPEYASQ